MNREFLLLAHPYKEQNVGGYFVSIKLDGQRCFWDGGVTRGHDKRLIPWANNEKDGRYKEKQVATGLWTRYGNIIHAPDWWLDELPKNVLLDGELYCGRGMFQTTRSIVADLEPGPGWQDVKYHVFDMPSPRVVMQTGHIKSQNMNLIIDHSLCESWFKEIKDQRLYNFVDTYKRLENLGSSKVVKIVGQAMLPSSNLKAREELVDLLLEEDALGGEGLMLRDPLSYWLPKRAPFLLKLKKFKEDVAMVVGAVAGKEGKHSGRMGALIVVWEGKRFHLSGFTDEERILLSSDVKDGEEILPPNGCVHFTIGTSIRFKYRELTDDGIPKEARYWR